MLYRMLTFMTAFQFLSMTRIFRGILVYTGKKKKFPLWMKKLHLSRLRRNMVMISYFKEI